MSEQPLILFATIAAGGGHVATAKAMMQAVDKHYPGAFRLELSDLMLDLGFEHFDKQHKESWKQMLRYPVTARVGQLVIDRFPAVTRFFNRRTLRAFAAHASEVLKERQPALIVANHPFLTVALTLSQQQFGLQVPVVTLTTEPVDVSALWAEPQAERFIVPSEPAKRDLVRLGVSATKIDLIGYPVQEAFLEPLPKREARAQLGLRDRFTCLVTLGGEGVGGHPLAFVRTLLAQDIQTVVVTGRNERLKAQLEHNADPLLRVLGFTDQMAQYLAACDVVLAKIGAATGMEALAVGRPLLVMYYAGLNELKALRYLERKGFGYYVTSEAELLAAIRHYQDATVQAQVTEAMAAQDFAAVNQGFAQYLVHYARYRQPLALALEGLT